MYEEQRHESGRGLPAYFGNQYRLMCDQKYLQSSVKRRYLVVRLQDTIDKFEGLIPIYFASTKG